MTVEKHQDGGGHLFVPVAARWPMSGTAADDDDDAGLGSCNRTCTGIMWVV